MVVIGVTDIGEITGVTINPESVQTWINEIKSKTSPSIIPDSEVIEFGGNQIVVLSIQEYPIKPVSTRGKYFKRVANSNHLMSLDEITNEHLKTINTSWDFYPDPNHGIEQISTLSVMFRLAGLKAIQRSLTAWNSIPTC